MQFGKPRPQDSSGGKISAFIFEAAIRCTTKCFLRSRGEAGVGNGYADWVMRQVESYRKDGVERLAAGVRRDDCVIGWSGMENLKASKWQLAINLVANWQNLETSLHALERVQSKGRGNATQFIPIRFVFSNKITRDDKVLVAFDAFVLSELLGREVNLGRLIHGDKHVKLNVKTLPLVKRVRKLIMTIEAMLSSNSPPDLVLNRHCAECEFQTLCRQKAIEKNDLSLLGGMTERDRKKFNSKGIFTITQLSYTFRPRRRGKRKPDHREKYHHALKALSLREHKIHIVGRPEPWREGKRVFIDVEGLPDRDTYYLIGVRLEASEGILQHSLWADEPDEEERIWADFLNILSAIDKPVLVHYGRFETAFVKRMCSRYGNPPEGSQMAKALGSMVNLVSDLFARIYFPTFSNGLKEIAEYLGFIWSTPIPSGVHTIPWRYEWETTKDPSLKEIILTYNAQDCEALHIVTNWVGNLAQTFREGGGQSVKDVVDTETLKRDSPFGFKRNIFFFPELDIINKAAYWDYQRERVYVKSNECLKKVLSRSPRRRKVLSPNQTIECSAPRSCPRCRSTRFYADGKKRKTVTDLKFMKHGIKRWVVLYHFHRYRCRKCGAVFLPEERYWTSSRYGPGIAAYSLYMNIGLRLSQRIVNHTINRLFGYHLAIGLTRRIKERAAHMYKDTYDALVKRLCNGQLIHIDETKVSIGGKDGFVWVLANMEEVAYIYTETRQGDMLHNLLKDFTGVLVSDFYAAYDGVQCPQQKCLIHLIRDLNDALLKYPFDEELKNLVKGFADLVRPMVETIDRHGLKSYFLRKHLVAVNRFFRRISGTAFQSESAVKFKERFEKNRDKLFTFLAYDGVPWNNNNAEHAVKAFVMLRHVIDGVTSEQGLRDYLVMLSISETCKYKKVDFLDFLLSDEKDVAALAKTKRRRQLSSLSGATLEDDLDKEDKT